MSKSKNVFITGCNRGIGLELSKHVLDRLKPENLIVTCRDPGVATELNELASKYGNLHVVKLDVRDTEKYADVVAKVDEITGGEGINLLINNAGVLTSNPPQNSIFALEKDNLLYHLEVNTVAPIMLTKAFLPLLEKASVRVGGSSPVGIGKATILNISTKVASIEDNSGGGMYCYRSSKTALNMLTKCMSLELKEKGILTALMHPGWVKTDMGGNNAPLTTEASASGIVNVLETLGETDNGKFFQFDGKEIPW